MMTNNLSYYHIVLEGTKEEAANTKEGSDHWGALVCSLVTGLLSLFLFLVMGGVFALVGPWVIVVGNIATRRRAGREFFCILTAAAFFCLGIAALLGPGHISSWGLLGGMLGLLSALRYLLAALSPSRKTLLRPSTSDIAWAWCLLLHSVARGPGTSLLRNHKLHKPVL